MGNYQRLFAGFLSAALLSSCRTARIYSDPDQAVRAGDAAAVQAWLAGAPSQDRLNGALHIAAARGSTGLLSLLLAAGAELESEDAQGLTALMRACVAGHTGAVQYLLEQGADPAHTGMAGYTPSLLAAVNGHLDIVFLLQKKNPACGLPDLNYVAFAGMEPPAEALLKAGADPEIRTLPVPPALVTACRKNLLLLTEGLLAKGGDPQMRDSQTGESLLSIAAKNGLREMAALLIRFGADPNRKDQDGSFPLIRAAQSGDPALAGLLLDAGAQIDMTDSNNATAAFGAALQNDAQMLELLAARGADFSIASAWGIPAEYARNYDKPLAAAFFEGK